MNEQELFDVEVPEKTESYSPVSHQQIVEEIQENVDKSGLKIVGKRFQAARGGKRVTGLIDLAADQSSTFNYRLAFRNSYDKSMTLAFVGGTSVMICSNGMIIGEEQFIRKHTGTITQEMDEKIKQVIGGLDEVLNKANNHSERMKNIELDPTATAELCGRLFMEQEIITSSQLNIIKDQLKEPDHPEFADPNLWSLYNHTTHALKKTYARTYVDKYKQLHEFVEGQYQLT